MNTVFTSPQQLVQTQTVRNILHGQGTIHSVRSTDLLPSALEVIVTNHISSVPVFSVVENRFASFFDLLDLVFYLGELLHEDLDLEAVKAKLLSTSCEEAKNIRSIQTNWSGSFLDKLSDTDTLKKAISLITAFVNLHRLPVFTLTGDLVGIISQSDIVYAIAPHINLFPIANKSVKDIGLGIRSVVSISQDATLKDAVLKLKEHVISGIAVLDENELLIGAVSAADVKIIGNNFSDLDKLNLSIKECFHESLGRPHHLTLDCTVQKVFERFSEEKLHRIWVADSGKVVGVITAIDLISLISKYF